MPERHRLFFAGISGDHAFVAQCPGLGSLKPASRNTISLCSATPGVGRGFNFSCPAIQNRLDRQAAAIGRTAPRLRSAGSEGHPRSRSYRRQSHRSARRHRESPPRLCLDNRMAGARGRGWLTRWQKSHTAATAFLRLSSACCVALPAFHAELPRCRGCLPSAGSTSPMRPCAAGC
jgi:hypothetical protein